MRRARLTLLAALAACSPSGPRALALGTDECAHCHMTLTDSRFTAEVVSAHGKTIMFDDVGCLAAWLGQNSAPIASTWVMSFADRRRWIQADSAVYLRVDSIRTPMASSLLALPPGHEADSVQAAIGGIRVSWQNVLVAPPARRPSARS